MQLDKDNPWPGLASFEEDAHAFFFGREREIKLLQDNVLDSPVTVLYGCSGLGKTSLLQAGLFPALREQHFLQIYVRFELKPGAAPLTLQLHHAVRNSIHADVPDPMLPSDTESLWEYLHRNDFELWSARNYLLTPLIVLDQFEELFTIGERVPELVRAFRDDLGDLAENRIPAELAARIEDDATVATRFQLRSRKYKLLISLREDYLPDLEGWRNLVPALGRSRVRLLHLQASDALAAVHKPAEHLISIELARQLVDFVAGQDLRRRRDTAIAEDDRSVDDRDSDVEPALLSLFCRELNEERKRRGQSQFDRQLIEDAKRDILSNYYSTCVRNLDPRVARFIETKLITEKGYRNSYIREEAVPAHLSEEELDRLIDSRLVRIEDRYGAPQIELTHDVLTDAVREHRDRRRAEEKAAKEKAALAKAAKQAHEREQAAQAQAADQERAKLEAQRQAHVLRKRTRILYTLLALVVVVAVAAVFALGWGLKKQRDAHDRLQEATAVRLYGDSQLMLAELSPLGSKDVALIQRLLAAHAIPSKYQDRTYELFTALTQERDLLKIIDLPARVFSVAFSPDGTRIASGSVDTTVRLWDTRTGQPIGQPLHHDDTVTSVAFSPDGTRLASGSWDKTVRLWDTRTGQPIGQPLHHDDTVTSVAFSADGTRLASGSWDKTIRLWDTRTGQPIGEPLRGDGAVLSVAFSPDGTRLASGNWNMWNNNAQLWNTDSRQPIGQPMHHDDAVNSVAFSPDGTRLATGSDDKTVKLWDARTGQPFGPPLRHDDSVLSVAFSPDGTRIAAASFDKTIRLWDALTLREVGVLRGHESAVTEVAFSRDSQRLVSAGGGDGTVRLWDTRSWQPMLGHDGTAWAAFSDDGRRIGSGGSDKTVRWWDTATRQPIGAPLRVDDNDVTDLFPVGEDRLLSFGSIDTVKLWDRNGKPIGEPLRLPPDTEPVVTDDTTNPRVAAQVETGVVRLWNSDLQPVGETTRQDQWISAIEFSKDGHVVATGSADGTVRLWDSATGGPIGEPMKGPELVTSIAFSYDKRFIAVGCSCSSLRLWDTGTSKPVGEPISLGSPVSYAAFSHDGHTLASGTMDGKIQLWDVGDQSAIGVPLTGHTNAITSLNFSPDGTKLLSASDDHTLRLWPAPPRSPDAARDTLCAKLTHNMSREQWKSWVSGEVDYIEACPGLPEADYAG